MQRGPKGFKGSTPNPIGPVSYLLAVILALAPHGTSILNECTVSLIAKCFIIVSPFDSQTYKPTYQLA